ncbi:putative sodium/calcium exchanger 7 isoform X2 [Drosophila montana]|uniref:putative sodium/calcium exchanger 7 isoform X2 n=1 Tax=Drosophila montana TaxID=40370 RepID=UPI00313E1D72
MCVRCIFALRNQIRDLQETVELENLADTDAIVFKRKELQSRYDSLIEDDRIDILQRRSTWRPLIKGPTFTYMTRRSQRREALNISANRLRNYRHASNTNHNLFREFFVAINPISLDDWRQADMLTRLFYIAVAPITLICTIYIPLVDYELEKNGWSKLLNCIHIFLNPAITLIMGKAMLFRDKSKLWYYNIPGALIYGLYSLVITVPLAIFVMINSSTRCPPPYHWIYMLMNLTGSMFMTFQCATEISLIMNMISSIYDVPTDFMSATILPIAFALSQVVASVSLALQGYEKMAYAATIGGAYLNVIMNTGIAFFAKSIIGKNLTFECVSGTYGVTAYILLILGLATTLLWTLILNFNSRRSVGIFSMSIYGLFLIFAILIKSRIIHAYNKDDFIADALKS